ncbi:MAG: peptidoglycan synthetase [Bacteroidetes bacterium]|nr:MAG: peptidoglycan synthetase [Bacteroidota bacterium]REK07058.1 MAG: peptidoglycan synthetase [Bacteroidota bacterium]REK33596.1 MAG: peptidoglycan synthetase [Bacteroidota bacterium]REK48580.1 MAG: peptidoglycan synthetase [Bacteroidota bacterium]
MQRVHFIAIGGAAMHNLALAMQKNGWNVSGSDDEIAEPSRSRLLNAGLLPEKEGWFPEKISNDLEFVILGMHARADNPELKEAERKGKRILSYPEFLYEHSKEKKRVVIGGSHGKTTITSMILHVLKSLGRDFDYMVGAKIDGFDNMVRLSDAPLIILEGDEYLSSPVDRRPKFHLYKADIALISGIAWDHMNVFPTYESYTDQFRIFCDQVPANGHIVYCNDDKEVSRVVSDSKSAATRIPYFVPNHVIRNGQTFLLDGAGNEVPLEIFGQHNLLNLSGAMKICSLIGVEDNEFYGAIKSFRGAARRLELLAKGEAVSVFKDFAHSPSKLKATTEAVKAQFPGRRIIACMELHTFSSLNSDFLSQYDSSMSMADVAMVYYNPKTIEHKKLQPLTESQVKNAFGRNDLKTYEDSSKLEHDLLSMKSDNDVYLLMSSGTFDGMDLMNLAHRLTK